MKKWTILMLLLVVAVNANAQFEKRTKYIGASMSGLGLSYSSNERFRMGLDLEAGYFFCDNVLVKGNIGYEHTRYTDDVRIGVTARYYIIQNGIFLEAGAEYNHFTKSNNDVMIPVEVGYAFYLNQYLAVEPAVYYKMSLHDFSGNSTVGLSIGLSYYF